MIAVAGARTLQAMRGGLGITVKDELRQLVDRLDDVHAREALDYLRSHVLNEDTHSDDDLKPVGQNEDEMFLKRGRPTSADDPLWNIIGIGRSAEPTDVARFKDEYLAEAFTPKKR